MIKPWLSYHEPDKEYYFNRTQHIELYSFYQKLGLCGYCGEENCHETCEEAIADLGEPENPQYPHINDMTLQSLIDMIPEGMSPSDIKFKINIDASDMAYEGHSVSFYYKKPLPDRSEEYQKAYDEYTLKLNEYTKKLNEYNEWKKQQDILDLEKKLAELKK